MSSTRLKIDTSVATIVGSSSPKNPMRNRNHTLGPAHVSCKRPQRASTASRSLSISVVTPASSTNAACSSHLRNDQLSSSLHDRLTSADSPISPLLDETMCLTSEYVLAMHDFSPQQQSTCLSFRAGQVIHVLNRDASGWWDGELEGRRGWFPSNYVHADMDVVSLTEEELPRAPVSANSCPALLV
jgi:son of sevenless